MSPLAEQPPAIATPAQQNQASTSKQRNSRLDSVANSLGSQKSFVSEEEWRVMDKKVCMLCRRARLQAGHTNSKQHAWFTFAAHASPAWDNISRAFPEAQMLEAEGTQTFTATIRHTVDSPVAAADTGTNSWPVVAR
jgi:hypothetical protein